MEFRELDFEKVKKITVPTFNYVTSSGAQVLVLDQNFYDFLKSNELVERNRIEKEITNITNISGE